MSDYEVKKLSQIIDYTTGKLNSNAAVADGQYPFFTCARETYRTDTWSFDCECVILAGNNANAEYPIKYFDGGKFDAYQRTYVMTPKDQNELDIRYLYYVLELKLNLLKTLSTGATTKFLTKTILDDLKINLPDIRTQKSIVSKLAPLEDLIENNTRRIEILEEMARRIYREWFLHFRFPSAQGRLRSKALATERSGEQAIPADSKPKMVDSGTELGEIPEGWEVKKLEEVIELTYGIGLRKKDRVEGRYPVYGSSGIIDWHNDYHVEGPGVIVGRKGNVGSMFWEYENFNPIDTTYFVESSLPLTYAFFNLQNQNFINSDAAVPGLSKRQANTLPVLVPDEKILKNFDTKILQLFDLKRVLNEKNEKLKETRDLLLPKLISGKIDLQHLILT